MANLKPKNDTPVKQQQSNTDLSLAESEALFSSIGEGVIVTDAEGNISRINEQALTILQCKSEDMMGKWFPGVVVAVNDRGEKIPKLERPITEAFLTGKPIFKRVYYLRKDGSKVAVALTASPVLFNNRPIGAIEVFRDVTEEVKLEQSKDEFIALASHQLRTPATSVKQYAGMLLADFVGKLTPEQEVMVRKIYENNERQINIVNDLLKVAQIDAGKVDLSRTDVELNYLLESIVNDYRHKFMARSQKIILKIPEEQVSASIDNEHFRMALENLIDNASKYTPENKNITVSLSEKNAVVKIVIKDQGVGIPEHEQKRIFEKFTRLDNPLSIQVGGTGLGLYWVEKIIRLHGAAIRVKSKVDQGTSFIITIPKAL